MQLNRLRPAKGAKRGAKRVGRGSSSGHGKTCGRGTKGQGARKSAGPRPGFEGGQMPLHRRMPKFGFSSRSARFSAEVRTCELGKCAHAVIDVEALRSVRLIHRHIKRVKVIAGGQLTKSVTIRDLAVTKGAKALIEAAGGKIE